MAFFLSDSKYYELELDSNGNVVYGDSSGWSLIGLNTERILDTVWSKLKYSRPGRRVIADQQLSVTGNIYYPHEDSERETEKTDFYLDLWGEFNLSIPQKSVPGEKDLSGKINSFEWAIYHWNSQGTDAGIESRMNVNLVENIVQVSGMKLDLEKFLITSNPKKRLKMLTNGNDVLVGSNRDDAPDHLIGGNGKDYLIGRRGDDILEGGNGKDTYFLSGSVGDRTVIGFEKDKDKLEIKNANYTIKNFNEDSVLTVKKASYLFKGVDNLTTDDILLVESPTIDGPTSVIAS